MAPQKTIAKSTTAAKAPRAPKARVPIVPAFGPAGCDLEQWNDYARQLRMHFESGGSERDVPGGIRSWAPAPSSPPSSLSSTPRTRSELMSALDSRNTRVINIQEPWATMIAKHGKDVENRCDPFPMGGGWMVVVASKVNYSGLEWEARLGDIRRRMLWSGRTDPPPTLPAFHQSELAKTAQHAIAVAKVRSVNNWSGTDTLAAKQSIWNNGDAFAWKITEVHALPEPVFFGNGTLGKPYLYGCNPTFKDQLRHQLGRLAQPEERAEVHRVVAELVNRIERANAA